MDIVIQTPQPVALAPWPCPELEHTKVLLASNSPRRRELLAMILRQYDIAASRDVDESYPHTIEAHEVPAYISQAKARAYASEMQPNELIITADTVVIDGNDILGKPHGRDGAVAMLRRLAGHTHTVVTGVTLTTVEKSETFSERTEVTFGALSDAEIEEYVDIYRPFDKAGAYGIQEWIGAVAIADINGCFYNVMGLPLHALYNHLRTFFSK